MEISDNRRQDTCGHKTSDAKIEARNYFVLSGYFRSRSFRSSLDQFGKLSLSTVQNLTIAVVSSNVSLVLTRHV